MEPDVQDAVTTHGAGADARLTNALCLESQARVGSRMSAATRPFRPQRNVPVQARRPTLEFHHPCAADPATFRLAVP